MSRTVQCFYPGRSFPAVSVTGADCSLNCRHCSGKYLEGMIPATTPDELIGVAEALAERGASGFLLSGGADNMGKVCLAAFIGAVRQIKSTTDLKVNAHIGLSSRHEIEDLIASGIDSFSIDVYGSDATIRDVLGIAANAEDYFRVLSDLAELNAPTIAPHICVGVHGGRLGGELAAIDRLRLLDPEELVLISLIPTVGTAYQNVPPPDKATMLSVIRAARENLPDTKLMLGCMRSKKDRDVEFDLVEAGLDGIVMPANSTVGRLERAGYKLKKRAVCCSLP